METAMESTTPPVQNAVAPVQPAPTKALETWFFPALGRSVKATSLEEATALVTKQANS